MRLYLLLLSLISVANIVSTATIPRPIQIHDGHEEHKTQIDLCTTTPPTSAGVQSNSQQNLSTVTSPGNDGRRNFVSRGKDDHEKLVALCEAGFVTGCQQAIQEGAADAPTLQPKTLLESVLAPLSYFSFESTRVSVLFWLSFVTLSVALVRVAFFRQPRSEFPVLEEAEKRSHNF